MKKEQVRWGCRRGMLELDILLEPFFDKHFSNLSHEQQKTFEALLSEHDADLYNWFIGLTEPDDENLKLMIKMIKDAKINEHCSEAK